ncbi:MAG TPA: penicillin-binding protein 2 [Candidatus Saccharimonadales bacterium]|nr:penicillin-binding protein 2 [Candidatus Saccharimonadales bacterium]
MNPTRVIRPVKRARWLYACVVAVLVIFGVRIFYLQIIQHEHYRLAALADQFKEYQIAPTRGLIKAHDGDAIVPIVLNQRLYTVYADPSLVKEADEAAETLAATLGGKTGDYIDKLRTEKTRYVVIAKKVTEEQKQEILKHKYAGIGAQDQYYRIYPNGTLGSQLLGFVNNDGQGTYGIEQALDVELKGVPGQLKAVTDVNGVPLAANRDNVLIAPEPGKDVVLTIDLAMQKQLETILKNGLDKAKSGSGSALIIDPRDGAIKAMANYPTYDPSNYGAVEDANLFNNSAVSSSLEVGSIMKPLTAAAALNLGAIKADTTYFDPAQWPVDDRKITNIEEDGGAARRSVQDILSLSLNTGATWFLMQMSEQGKTEITKSGRERWHDYMVNHFRFGKPTGIEQGYEDSGYVPDPNEGFGLNLTYANTAFGQGMQATPLQMAGAFSAIVNGGTYYQPRLIDMTISGEGKSDVKAPIVSGQNVVSPSTSADMRRLLEGVIASKTYIRPAFNLKQYSVGGKTGTAEIAKPGGGYHEHEFNGTYLGFVGGDMPQYVIAIRVNQPKIGGYAGTAAAQPIFVELAHMLIDDFGVTPRGH